MATTATTLSETTNSATAKDVPSMTYLPQMQQTYTPPLIANENAFLGDVATSKARDPDSPITAGFFRLQPGTPLVYTYTYHEMKIILEGDYTITDVTTLSESDRSAKTLDTSKVKQVKAKPGDVFYFPKGVTIRFETDAGGFAFYTGRRAEGEA
ncbi:MAG: hypothetical protein Q9162_005913 [Coniocarpon cinnabarinum]